MDNPFPNDFQQNLLSDLQASQSISWEERVVKCLLKHYSLTKQEPYLRSLCQEVTGNSHLLFHWFHFLHPSFPVYLLARKVTYVHQLSLPVLLDIQKFTKSSLFKTYQECETLVPAEWIEEQLPIGLVFELVHSKNNIKILHNHYQQAQLTTSQILLHFQPNSRRPEQTYVIESLVDFLKNLNWQVCIGS